ncbi:MAG: DUF58 domain-containing protein, partial [Thermoanaerobaculia bacterium]|nr:DUF58 domain-containing protein [Thermoanaerobaculia bacterium]
PARSADLREWVRAPQPGSSDPPGAATLPAGLTKKVRRIEIATKRLVAQGVAGEYHSVFKGRGVEFSEVRPYQPGDDVRSIDWNVTARMGQPYVKQFVEERDLSVFLAVDVSGSLSFGSRAITKRDLVAEVAALIAFSAVANGDRVGAGLLASGLELFLPPERRRAHVLRIVREILVRPAHGGTDLETGLSAVVSTLKRRGVLFFLSDFLGPLPVRALEAAAARHDVIVLEIVDPHDDQLPRTGPLLLTDAETGRVGLVEPKKLAAEHAARRTRERRELARLLGQLGCDHLVLTTDRPYLASLVGFFEARRRRYGR